MPFITWDQSFSVEIEEIDEQHKKLFAIINELHAAMKEGMGNEILTKILKDLIEYTHFHFSFEEKYFDRFLYEKAEQHKAAHDVFVKKVEQFEEDSKEAKATVTIETLNFLVKWLETHIKGTDKEYVQCFHEHGLK